MSGFTLPDHAHVPGHNARHAEDHFDAIKATARAGMTIAELRNCDAYAAGFTCFDAGYFWEAHEVWEAVWMATPPNSKARHFVQALIQLANTKLKLTMDKPKAAARLREIVQAHLNEAGDGGGMAIAGRGTDWVIEQNYAI